MSRRFLSGATAVGGLTLALIAPLSAQAAPAADPTPQYPSDSAKPDLIALNAGYSALWISDGKNDLHGTVVNPRTLSRDDRLVVWANNHATAKQRLKALQDAQYDNNGKTYDQSVTISTGLGKKLSRLYVEGLENGELPLTKALVNSETGSMGAYVGTSTAKNFFSHPRPYLPSSPNAAPVPGDTPLCAPSKVNSSSQAGIRVGKKWADATGTLNIQRLPKIVDTSHQFSRNDVELDPDYGTDAGICTGGSFPSGHTTTAYQAGLTLATLIPRLAPEVLSRASEAANNRMVVGVHYPLNLMGGRISGEAAVAARWSDPVFRTQVIAPAQAELIDYLTIACEQKLNKCAKKQKQYTANPFGKKKMPGLSNQRVTDRKSAISVYEERLTYGFKRSGKKLKPSVPAGAENLLLSTFPKLTDAQRRAVLAQTEIKAGYPLDQTASGAGSWQRLDLAAAMSATVKVSHGKAKVVSTGGQAKVIK